MGRGVDGRYGTGQIHVRERNLEGREDGGGVDRCIPLYKLELPQKSVVWKEEFSAEGMRPSHLRPIRSLHLCHTHPPEQHLSLSLGKKRLDFLLFFSPGRRRRTRPALISSSELGEELPLLLLHVLFSSCEGLLHLNNETQGCSRKNEQMRGSLLSGRRQNREEKDESPQENTQCFIAWEWTSEPPRSHFYVAPFSVRCGPPSSSQMAWMCTWFYRKNAAPSQGNRHGGCGTEWACHLKQRSLSNPSTNGTVPSRGGWTPTVPQEYLERCPREQFVHPPPQHCSFLPQTAPPSSILPPGRPGVRIHPLPCEQRVFHNSQGEKKSMLLRRMAFSHPPVPCLHGSHAFSPEVLGQVADRSLLARDGRDDWLRTTPPRSPPTSRSASPSLGRSLPPWTCSQRKSSHPLRSHFLVNANSTRTVFPNPHPPQEREIACSESTLKKEMN